MSLVRFAGFDIEWNGSRTRGAANHGCSRLFSRLGRAKNPQAGLPAPRLELARPSWHSYFLTVPKCIWQRIGDQGGGQAVSPAGIGAEAKVGRRNRRRIFQPLAE